MSIQDLVRRHQFREGFDLVDYAEVGLPVFRLTIEAVTMARRPIPTIDEFVMRSIEIGESSSTGIATFLGLSRELVQASVQILRTAGLIMQKDTDGGHQNFGLTEQGKNHLIEGAYYEPQEEMLVVDFDGIRRKPIWLGTENLIRTSELADTGALELRPYPATPPEVEDLKISEISTVIRRQTGNEFARDILALKRVVKRSNVFRTAIALVFRGAKSKETQIGFLVGDRQAEDYELEFAARGGPQKMGLIRQLDDSDGSLKLRRRLGPEIWSKVPERNSVIQCRRALQETYEGLEALKLRADSRGGTSGLTSRELLEFQLAEERVRAAEQELRDFPIRPLAPYEQGELLAYALNRAQKKLLISSRGLHSHLVDGRFLRELDFAIERGAHITIATTLRPTTQSRKDKFDPLIELSIRAQKTMYFTLARLRRSETLFALVKDEDLALLSNRPFLGDRGPRPSLFCVNGIVSSSPPIIEKVASIFQDGLEMESTN